MSKLLAGLSCTVLAMLPLTQAAAEPTPIPYSQVADAAPAAAAAAKPVTPEFKYGDEVFIGNQLTAAVRSGPSNNYRVVANQPAGTKFKFVAFSRSGKFAQIDDGSGRKLWINASLLTHQAPQDLNALLGQIDELKAQLNAAQASDTKLKELQRQNAELTAENQQLKAQLNDNTGSDEPASAMPLDLQSQEFDMQMRWWLQGALIALGGALAGIVLIYLPRPGRRRRDRY